MYLEQPREEKICQEIVDQMTRIQMLNANATKMKELSRLAMIKAQETNIECVEGMGFIYFILRNWKIRLFFIRIFNI